jgi:hypothetical protein
MIEFILTNDAGEERKLTAKPRDVLNWEKTTKGAKFSDFESGVALEDLYKVAYFAAKRALPDLVAGRTQAEFEGEWDVLPTGGDDADPTPEGR